MVEKEQISAIKKGLLLFIGVEKGDTTTKQVYDPDSLPVSVTLSPTEPTLIVRYRATGLELPPVRLTGLISKFC